MYHRHHVMRCATYTYIRICIYKSLRPETNKIFSKIGYNACLRCQAENKRDVLGRQDCVVVWGECNHSFHHCCMSLWVKQNNRCPLCQQEWSIQRMGK
ncbi:hypothetical protein FF38_12238 [Lucilia cuprina]|uniref:RING-type domain-containing protein n=1 Tax=Lucilia cuprina TaxID=7375 RepID=A0A0L0C3Q2_LUCCU|nr:hypothetical protein FF38_12238 [Lucilia cuprina]